MKNYIKLNNEVMQKVEGFYQLEKDKLAVSEFQNEVNERLMKFQDGISRIEWLIENDYYVDFFEMYSKDDVARIIDKVYTYKF